MWSDKKTQKEKVLFLLKQAGGWFSGMNFLRLEHPITQFHARIFELQREGYDIVSRKKPGYNYCEYRLFI